MSLICYLGWTNTTLFDIDGKDDILLLNSISAVYRGRSSKSPIRAHLRCIFASWPRKTLFRPKIASFRAACKSRVPISFATLKIPNFNQLEDFHLNSCWTIFIPIINTDGSMGTTWTWPWWCHKWKSSLNSKDHPPKLILACLMETIARPRLILTRLDIMVMPKWLHKLGHLWKYLHINAISI